MNAALLSQIHRAVFPKGWSAAEITEMLTVAGTFAMELDGQGMILIRVAGEQADLLTLAVLPEFRRRGVARALLAQAMPKVASMGAGKLFLEVEEDNVAAQELYASCGFTAFSRRKEYYDGKDAVVMCADLT